MHTTGIDIQHTIDAVAIVTLGPDMTLRDYAQGCWRMRGLGRGQGVHLWLVPEVAALIAQVSSTAHVPTDAMAWLAWNGVRSNTAQQTALAQQCLRDVWRRSAWRQLRAHNRRTLHRSAGYMADETVHAPEPAAEDAWEDSTAWAQECAALFREPLDHALPESLARADEHVLRAEADRRVSKMHS